MQLYRGTLHFNGNNKPARFESLFFLLFCASTHHQLGGRIAAPGTSVQRRLRQKVSRRSPVPKSVNCAQLLREGYITHNILPLQRLISGGRVKKKKGQTFLETVQYITVTLGGCNSYISPCRGVSSAWSHRRDPHCTLSKIDGVS